MRAVTSRPVPTRSGVRPHRLGDPTAPVPSEPTRPAGRRRGPGPPARRTVARRGPSTATAVARSSRPRPDRVLHPGWSGSTCPPAAAAVRAQVGASRCACRAVHRDPLPGRGRARRTAAAATVQRQRRRPRGRGRRRRRGERAAERGPAAGVRELAQTARSGGVSDSPARGACRPAAAVCSPNRGGIGASGSPAAAAHPRTARARPRCRRARSPNRGPPRSLREGGHADRIPERLTRPGPPAAAGDPASPRPARPAARCPAPAGRDRT